MAVADSASVPLHNSSPTTNVLSSEREIICLKLPASPSNVDIPFIISSAHGTLTSNLVYTPYVILSQGTKRPHCAMMISKPMVLMVVLLPEEFSP